MALFQKVVLQKYLNALDNRTISLAYEKFKSHFGNPAIQENIRNLKEEGYQEGFVRDLFVNVLGYTLDPQPQFNFVLEKKNVNDNRKADGAILQDGKVSAVIELKGTDTIDLDHVENQAFIYKENQRGCRYAITSNFEKLRLYVEDRLDPLNFDLFNLEESQFRLLYLCLQKDNLLNNLPLRIKNESLTEEKNITQKLYKDYSEFKRKLYQNICAKNPSFDKLLVYKKTQKLLDRFLFVLFAEDKQLLSPNFIRGVLEQWKMLKKNAAYFPLYERYKLYFSYIDIGAQEHDIFAFNGGLFMPDDVLDNIQIDDDLLYENTLKLSLYNFDTEVDVDILGHIFEHSLNDIDTITAEMEGRQVEIEKTRRKKDGIFYTPKYITKYIVENTVGNLCEEKKTALGIKDEDYAAGKKKKDKKSLNDTLVEYRQWLLELTILDPACGSGAFLNQALEFLIAEHRKIEELRSRLFGDAFSLPEVENMVIENNLYGVDLNEESIEIAKLSLWLRTAKKGRKLSTLNANIKCGNSLINDAAIAGDKAFNWREQFADVFAKGGFDVVIGNPPYGILMSKADQAYYDQHFPFTNYKTNLYVLFVERMVQLLNKGVVNFIIPKSLLFNTYYDQIRRHLIQQTEINEILTITEKVFDDAEVGSSLLLKFTIKEKIIPENPVRLASFETIENFVHQTDFIENSVPQNFFLTVPNAEISITSSSVTSILDKLHSLKSIGEYYKLKNGLNPGNVKDILISKTKESELHKPIIWGKDISKYCICWSGEFICYDEEIGERITLDDIQSKEGMNKQNKIDFALRTPDLFEQNKIVIRKTGDSLIACFDDSHFYFDTLVHGIYEVNSNFPLGFLLAILNSRSATFFYRLLHDIKGKVFAKISLDNLSTFPIPDADTLTKQTLSQKAILMANWTVELCTLQTRFLTLLQSKVSLEKPNTKIQEWYKLDFKEFSKELEKAKVRLPLADLAEWMGYFDTQKQMAQELNRHIVDTNKEIERVIHRLYNLTPDEIRIVEENKS